MSNVHIYGKGQLSGSLQRASVVRARVLMSFSHGTMTNTMVKIQALNTLPFSNRILGMRITTELTFKSIYNVSTNKLLQYVGALMNVRIRRNSIPSSSIATVLSVCTARATTIRYTFTNPIGNGCVYNVLIPTFRLRTPRTILVLMSITLMICINLNTYCHRVLHRAIKVILRSQFNHIMSTRVLPSIITTSVSKQCSLIPILHSRYPGVRSAHGRAPRAFKHVLAFSNNAACLIKGKLRGLCKVVSFNDVRLSAKLLRRVRSTNGGASSAFNNVLAILNDATCLYHRFLRYPGHVMSLKELR